MENRKAKMIRQIDRLLSGNELLKQQRQTLTAFDRFNELEAQCRLGTRLSYLQTLVKLGAFIQRPFEKMKREELQLYIAEQKRRCRPSGVALQLTHMKRFFRWIEYTKTNHGLPDEQRSGHNGC